MDLKVRFDDLVVLLTAVLSAQGLASPGATIIARTIALAEADGTRSHGLLRVPGYVSSLKSGWASGVAVPTITTPKPGVVCVDAKNGFAQVGLAAARSLFVEKVREQGVAVLAMHDSHHFAALYGDVEPLALEGLLAIAVVNTRSRVAPATGSAKLLGTNPMAFACPRLEGPPMIWDQASSIMSQGDVLLAMNEGRSMPPGIGIDKDGLPTTDPKAILEGGSLLPFGGHKGHAIALLVELLAAALTGAPFGYQDASRGIAGAVTARGGQCIIAIDPQSSVGDLFYLRAEDLLRRVQSNGNSRLPGDRRLLTRKQSLEVGVSLSRDAYEAVQKLL